MPQIIQETDSKHESIKQNFSPLLKMESDPASEMLYFIVI